MKKLASTFSGFKEHQLIPFPCHLNWEDLGLRESTNKHCSECDCEVRDLTDMTSDEIYALQDKLDGKLCGKIYKKDNYVVTEVEINAHDSLDEKQADKSILSIPSIISGGIAALSLASCSSTKVTEQNLGRIEAKPFPNDGERRPVKLDKRIEQPPCLMGIIALPPKN